MLEIPILILIYPVAMIKFLYDFMTMYNLSNGVTLYVAVVGFFSISIQSILGYKHYKGAIKAFNMRAFTMDTLIVISTTASILFGISLACIGYPGVILGSEDH